MKFIRLFTRPRRRRQLAEQRIIEGQRIERFGYHLCVLPSKVREQPAQNTRLLTYQFDPRWVPYAVVGMPGSWRN